MNKEIRDSHHTERDRRGKVTSQKQAKCKGKMSQEKKQKGKSCLREGYKERKYNYKDIME